ncbi:MAG: PfkB family carbohydrate kinase, partial [Streptosporangiaceae bacterium]
MSGLVAVVGSLNADLTLPVPHLPQPGETVVAAGPAHLAFGGKGANQAVAAAAFGGQVAMIGRVGADEIGLAILADLERLGIDVRGVLASEGDRTGTATIAVDEAGENLILVDPGANRRLIPADVTAAPLGAAAVLLVQLEIPLTAMQAAVAAAGPRTLVVLNPAPAEPVGQAVLDRVDVLVPNRSELGLLAGAAVPGTLDGVANLARKAAVGTDVVVTLGGDGALVVPGNGGAATHIAAPAATVLDGTGAGDCFCGCLAVLLAEGAVTLAGAARLALAAATISTAGRGARGRLPGRDEAERLAAGLGVSPAGARWEGRDNASRQRERAV